MKYINTTPPAIDTSDKVDDALAAIGIIFAYGAVAACAVAAVCVIAGYASGVSL